MSVSLSRMRTRAAVLLLSAGAVTMFATAASTPPAAAHSCEAEYDTAGLAINTEIQGHGDRQKLRTKLDNAWRAFWKDKKLEIANSQLDMLEQLLHGNATKGVTAGSREVVTESVSAFRRCINGETPIGTATLAIQTFNFDETAEGGRGQPAGAGVYLFVDGKHVASTDESGAATVTVPAGIVNVQAIVPSTALAEAVVQADKGTTVPLELILDDSKEVSSPVQLSVSGMSEHVLRADAEDFTITLLDGGTPRAATAVSEVAIEDDIGNTLAVLTDAFAIDAAGRIYPTSVATVVDAVRARAGRSLVLRVVAEDALGFTLVGTTPLYFGQYALQVALVAPPSNPQLPLGGIEVAYRLMGSDLVLVRTSDGNGMLSFDAVPLGNASLESVTTRDGRFYYGEANFFLARGSQARVTMTHADDIANGVPRFELLPITGAASTSVAAETDEQATAERQALHDAYVEESSSSFSALATASLRVGAGQANQQISRSTTLTVPRGTRQVTLRYQVTTLEYPYYVQQQSVYNDTWSLSVRARQTGLQLFSIARNVNSQLTQAPIWRADGSTGYIERSLDVSTLTAEADAQLLLAATAMNVADSLLPTIVEAELSDDPDRLVIDEVVSDTLASTTGDSRSYSIPLQGETNSLARWFTLRITKPDGAQVTRVKAELQHGGGTMGPVLEEGPGANVQVVDDRTLRVRVTFHGAGGTINTVPPPAHGITYKFTVYAQHDGSEISDDAISAAKRGLWRMQAAWRDPSRRYGARDAGGDDWLAAATWNYINRHGGLLTRIDDISGEHGRNIGHQTHDVGTDIDLYHVYRFAGATSGSDNYNRLRNTVVRVLSLPADQTQADREAVTAWVSQTRARFAAILDTTDAQRVYYAIGSAHTASGIALPRGWARSLLVDGSISASEQRFDTGLGAWNYGRAGQLGYDAVHNSHFHIKRPRDR